MEVKDPFETLLITQRHVLEDRSVHIRLFENWVMFVV
jgi:hypothetical protein